jgi:excisionase family DNA binding protein
MQTQESADWTCQAAISVERAAQVLDVHSQTLRASIAAGEVPSLRIGRRIVVPVAGLKKLLGMAA